MDAETFGITTYDFSYILASFSVNTNKDVGLLWGEHENVLVSIVEEQFGRSHD